jgi:hypothetical protein
VYEQANRTNQKAVEAAREGRAPPTKEDRPLIAVDSNVDTDDEIAALKSWAKKHRPQLSAGQLMYTPRTLPLIENVHVTSH